jgi:hypothetical protein
MDIGPAVSKAACNPPAYHLLSTRSILSGGWGQSTGRPGTVENGSRTTTGPSTGDASDPATKAEHRHTPRHQASCGPAAEFARLA